MTATDSPTPTTHRGHCRTCGYVTDNTDRRRTATDLAIHQQRFGSHITVIEAPNHRLED